MYNKFLEYLLQNEPKNVISNRGIRIRKRLSPVLYKLLIPIATRNKLVFSYAEKIPENVPIIFAANHGIHDDIVAGLKGTSTHTYVLFGSLPIFFNTFDGISLWLNGVILVDRKNKDSRKASKEKMKYVLSNGTNILMYPEGVWNKSENLLLLKLYPGIYDIAKETGALIVPMGIIEENGTVYTSVGKVFDITQYEKKEGLEILRDTIATLKYELMEKHSKVDRKSIGDAKLYWQEYLSNLIATTKGYYDYEIENTAHFQDKNITEPSEAFEHLNEINISPKTAFLTNKRLM